MDLTVKSNRSPTGLKIKARVKFVAPPRGKGRWAAFNDVISELLLADRPPTGAHAKQNWLRHWAPRVQEAFKTLRWPHERPALHCLEKGPNVAQLLNLSVAHLDQSRGWNTVSSCLRLECGIR